MKTEKTERVFVILGLDRDQKPHAARFSPSEEVAARKAAAATGFRFGAATSKEAVLLAGRLVAGKLFDSGKGLVPRTTPENYAQLLKLIDLEAVPPAAISSAGAAVPTGAEKAATLLPNDPRTAIAVGSVVLVQDREPLPNRAWWECVVTAVGRNPNDVIVKWKAFPALKPFSVKRAAVALLPVKQ
ncbi:MAG: hypothetical protein JWR21_827 [Herminiimonas sp.]|nr:hypothetical protein [Herminiimonas sp.]